MAVILKLPTQARSLSPPRDMAGASAEILFFTGVRYERTGAAADRKAPARQRRRRPQRNTKTA
ncbi:MAG: hypothetical protein K2Y29_19455 [Beijerinckiaceae bacterium]|nr:hypothetical protein [Beijerinckiaceae bacterium]